MTSLRSNPWVTLFVMCLALFMIVLDTTIVNIALPSIIDGLHAGLDQVLWILNAYILVYTVLLITAGRLGDIFGPRTVFVAGMAVFTLASAVSGLTPDIQLLIVARIVQGAGAALMTPQTAAIITGTFERDRRGAAFGIGGAVMSLGATAGPTLGGLLIAHWSWPWIFFINVPIGVLAIAAAFLLVPNLSPGERHDLDWVGIALASAGLSAVVFGLVEGQRYAWGTLWLGVTIPEVIVGGFLLLVAFLAWEQRSREPLMPLSLFGDRNFALMNAVTASMAFSILGYLLVMTLYLQSVLNMSALSAGLTLIPMSIASVITAPIAGRLVDKTGGKYVVLIALLLFGTGIAWIARLAGPQTPASAFVIPMILGGIGLGGINAPSVTIALRNISPQLGGVAYGVLNTMRQLGGVLGSAVMGAVLQNRLATALHAATPTYASQVGPGFRQSFINGVHSLSTGGLDAAASGGSGQITGVSPQAAQQVQQVLHYVFASSFVDAMWPTLAMASILLVLTSAGTLAIVQRRREHGRVDAPEAVDRECCTA